MMKTKFNSDDRCAIDLVLEHHAQGPSNAWSASCFSKSRDGKLLQREVQYVEKVLSFLAELPVSDPPANLVTKTLRRVEREGNRRPATVPHHIQAPATPRPASRQVH
jgi:hypothetical protein